METVQTENDAALAVFSNVDMLYTMRENFRSQNALEGLWSVFASCHFLHDQWSNPEFCPIKHPEFLVPGKQEQLPTSPFLHWFLWALESDIEVLQHIDLQFLHPFDENTEDGKRRLDAKAQGRNGYIGWDYYVNLNLSAPMGDIINSLMIVRKMDQLCYPRNIWEESPCLSVGIQANMWLGQVLLRKCGSRSHIINYLNLFRPNIFKDEDLYTASCALDQYKKSLFYNQPVLKHPKVGLLFGIMATRNCFFSIYAPEIDRSPLTHRILKIIQNEMSGIIHKRREYREKSIALCKEIRKELFETTIQAKIPNAWEIYENICLLLDKDDAVDNIEGIQKPD